MIENILLMPHLLIADDNAAQTENRMVDFAMALSQGKDEKELSISNFSSATYMKYESMRCDKGGVQMQQ